MTTPCGAWSRAALAHAQKQGLVGSHHFYLTFKTHDPGVEIPDFLRERYPDEMTIVLQNQYSGLEVSDDEFEVTLSFQKLPTHARCAVCGGDRVCRPGRAVRTAVQERLGGTCRRTHPPKWRRPQKNHGKSERPNPCPPPRREQSTPPAEKGETPQVVSLDKFRKK